MFLKRFYDADQIYWEDDQTLGIQLIMNKTQTVFFRNFEAEVKTQSVFLKLCFIDSDEKIVLNLEFEIYIYSNTKIKFSSPIKSCEPYDILHSCLDFTVTCKTNAQLV